MSWNQDSEGAADYRSDNVNETVYCPSNRVKSYIPDREKSDFIVDIFPALLRNGEHICAYRSPEYVVDIGAPGRLLKVEKDRVSGKLCI